MVEEKKEIKKETVYEAVEVPTETGLAIKTPEGNVVSQLDLLIEIANTLNEVKKGIVG